MGSGWRSIRQKEDVLSRRDHHSGGTVSFPPRQARSMLVWLIPSWFYFLFISSIYDGRWWCFSSWSYYQCSGLLLINFYDKSINKDFSYSKSYLLSMINQSLKGFHLLWIIVLILTLILKTEMHMLQDVRSISKKLPDMENS